MKQIIALAVAFAAIAIFSAPEASAQFSFNNGFQFGSGVQAAGGGFASGGFGRNFGSAFRGGGRFIRPPFFAEFPPVYYSGIVRRPYGISPFAAPAGVAPVELNFQPEDVHPTTVKNPFFNKNLGTPASVLESVDESSTKNKSTRVANPHFNNVPEFSGTTRNASFETIE